jgi:hypothetical protein
MFFLDMTREEVCEAYADEEGRKYGFTNKDWAWVNAKSDAEKLSDESLLLWCENNF